MLSKQQSSILWTSQWPIPDQKQVLEGKMEGQYDFFLFNVFLKFDFRSWINNFILVYQPF